MAGKRVLVFGITGIDKSLALKRLRDHCEADGRPIHIVSFESEFLFSDGQGQGSIPRNSFLDADPRRQREEWSRAWSRLADSIAPEDDRDIILSLHGCYIRGHYGSRWILDPNAVADFSPQLIITLIADVYDMWWRTESRAGGANWKGRPSLEQLVLGRRFEVAVADQVALAASCRHLVLAVGHPRETLARLIFKPRVKVVYLSFPISEPRRMAEKNDTTGLNAVSEFIAYAHRRQIACQRLACVCPLAIDELPFVRSLKDSKEGSVEFARDSLRWNLQDFWPGDEQLGLPAEASCGFPLEQVKNACGSIVSDVTWRDYRLVEQADCLAVYNPVFNNSGRISRGVQNEIDFATRLDRPVYIFQDPDHDRDAVCASRYGSGGGGTMSAQPGMTLITISDSVEALFDAIDD